MPAIQTSLTQSQLAQLQGSKLFNADLAPVPPERRKWRYGSFAALWISMSACIPTYMLASSLIGGGMNWWQAILTIFLGNLIVLIPMVLNAHAGTRYGIPFPVYCRAAFGTQGANVPVRHPDLDRWQRHLQDHVGIHPIPGLRNRFPCFRHQLPPVPLLPFLLGNKHAGGP
jgi:hypothetical protein